MNFKQYLEKHGRKLDLRLYEYLFEKADATHVLDELLKYQNSDGGFGNALEPDLRLPDSSALATTVAFQYLSQLDAVPEETMTRNAVNYLLSTYNETSNRWINIPPSADQHPRAPWWNYAAAKASREWGNPSAEILSYLLKYAPKTDTRQLQRLSEKALLRVQEISVPEPHEIKCFVRLYENADSKLQEQLHEPLVKLVVQVTNTNPVDWKGYVPTPLTFVASPDSPFAALFDKELLIKNAQFLQDQIVESSHWEPTWEWDQFEYDWTKAKQEWSGKLTVDNLRVLKAFGLDSLSD